MDPVNWIDPTELLWLNASDPPGDHYITTIHIGGLPLHLEARRVDAHGSVTDASAGLVAALDQFSPHAELRTVSATDLCLPTTGQFVLYALPWSAGGPINDPS
jgi:hypothetical protein